MVIRERRSGSQLELTEFEYGQQAPGQFPLLADGKERLDGRAVLPTEGLPEHAPTRPVPLTTKDHGLRGVVEFRGDQQAGLLASMLRTYQPQLIPGLLQTENFARAALTGGNPREPHEAVGRLVTGRMERQKIWGHPAPPHMVAVLDEVALTRPTGGTSAMSAQISRMLSLMDQRLLKVLVVPTERDGHPGLTELFTLLSLKDGRDLAYVEEALAGRMVHDREGIRTLSLQFGDLQEMALSPAESQRLLVKLKEGFDGTQLA